MRFWAVLGAMLLLVMFLMWKFPYVMGNAGQGAQIMYLVIMIALVASGSGLMRRLTTSQGLRDAALWLGIILCLALAYSYRHTLRGTRLYGVLVPSAVQVTQEGALVVHAAEGGHFYIEAEINGAPERFLVDTGASDIVLSPRAAQAAGFDIAALNYSRQYSTANGNGSGAPVRLDILAVGPAVLRDVPASVNNAPMDESLLGMAFLRQFSSYTFQGDTLTLYP
ncbi:MAG: TIGR02281 family clan AA aspartic protease [Proteobacteria bacterium]|nr:TIGR02281 family clan AA aspartic protease [Pseudomonadota bacterium]